MLSIRRGQFETNSSSVHKLIIMEKADFKKWESSDDEYMLDNVLFLEDGKDGLVFHTGAEVLERLNENESWSKYWAKNDCDDYIVFKFAVQHLGWFGYRSGETRTKEIDDKVAVSIYIDE